MSSSSQQVMDEEAARSSNANGCGDETTSQQQRRMLMDEKNPLDDDHDDRTTTTTTVEQPPRYEVLSTKSPIPGFHPTQAIIKDNVTGKTYKWNSRKHRKLRHVVESDEETGKRRKRKHHLPRLWSCEPHIVTWWVNLTNEIANIFWVIDGAFATWPMMKSNNAVASSKIAYAAGIIAGFFLILSCYFSYVEAINHTHADIVTPPDDDDDEQAKIHKRRFLRPRRIYGRFKSPLGHAYHGLDDQKKRNKLVQMGFPIIENTTTGKLITMDMLDEAISTKFPNDEMLLLQPVNVNIRSGKYVCTAQATHVAPVVVDDGGGTAKRDNPSYVWWTWAPAVNHVGVLCALIGFVSSMVYFIPMVVGYPLANDANASVGVTLFFVDILQVIPYMAFAAVGHLYIAEAADGSWWKPNINSIGYWIALWNTIGAYGFLLCGALAIPGTVKPTCCPNMAKWGSAFACFWGGCAYFVGGILMFIEFANPEPIDFGGDDNAKAKNDDSDEEGGAKQS